MSEPDELWAQCPIHGWYTHAPGAYVDCPTCEESIRWGRANGLLAEGESPLYTKPADGMPEMVEGFWCPRCRRVSYNPNDKREGYCGACHDWTARPARGGL